MVSSRRAYYCGGISRRSMIAEAGRVSISRRILLQVALATAAVIAMATAVTYRIVFEAARQRDLRHLETYVQERSLREEAGFRQIAANLTLVRGQLLKRMEAPIPSDYQTKWDERFRLFPDGAWRSREEFADGRKWSTLWAHRNAQLTPEWQTLILRAQDICNELLPGWVDAFPSVYFVLKGPANIGFDPRIPAWVWETPADYEVEDTEWWRVAMPPTPTSGLAYTGVNEELTTKTPMVSIYLPIVVNGEFVGSVGHDLWIDRLLDEHIQSGVAGAVHMIFRQDGRIIAHPAKRAEILASKGLLTMQGSGEPALASLYQAAVARPETQFSGYDTVSRSYYSVSRLSGPAWLFLTTMPLAQLRAQAFASAQWVLWSGLFSLGLVLIFFTVILRRQIARPLADLAQATQAMSAGKLAARAIVYQRDELGQLASSFNEMADRVVERDTALRALNQDLERQVDARTAELQTALATEHELSAMKTNFIAMVSHEFRTPLGVIMSAADVLDRYLDRLTPEKRREHLEMIFRSTRNLAQLVEGVLLLGKMEAQRMSFQPVELDLVRVCHQLIDEVHSANGAHSPIDFQPAANLQGGRSDPELLRYIFGNLLSNAVKYSDGRGPVDFIIRRQETDVICTVRDRGIGISEEDQKNLFKSFSRGRNVGQRPGTGLGLLIVQRCVELHGGTIEIQSLVGEGTSVTVKLPMFL